MGSCGPGRSGCSRLLAALLALAPAAAAQDPWALRVDFSQISLPRDERLGLAGCALVAEAPGGFYLGPALLGGVRGERGGFFAGGLEGGLRLPLGARLDLDGGLFMGGGGGGAAPVGGGFLLRPRLGLVWRDGAWRLGLGLSRLDFPGGAIRSSQAYLSLERRFTVLGGDPSGAARPRWPEAIPFHLEREAFEVTASRYGGQGARAGMPAVELGGFTWGRELGGPWFLRLEAAAAAHGGAAGYMEALAGLGLRLPLDARGRFALQGVVAAGSGGGGGTGTGGGLLVKAAAGLRVQANPRVHLFIESGRLEAPGGGFQARTWTLGAGFSLDQAVPGGGGRAPAGEPEALVWRLSSGFQHFSSAARSTGPAAALEQHLLKLEVSTGGPLYITGQSAWATGGGGGAWATGMLGLGLQTPARGGHRLRLELAGGAGGGGGVASGGGALVQATAGWLWECSRSWSVHAMAGRVRALSGGFASPVLEAGLGYRGLRLVRRPN